MLRRAIPVPALYVRRRMRATALLILLFSFKAESAQDSRNVRKVNEGSVTFKIVQATHFNLFRSCSLDCRICLLTGR